VARVLLARPRLLVIDRACSDAHAGELLGDEGSDATSVLFGKERVGTVILCTTPGDPLLARCDDVYRISEGTLRGEVMEEAR
jgi:predicted ABC-type transport system involved in lysophospholipase L1 biosynthesis ATPase subunit